MGFATSRNITLASWASLADLLTSVNTYADVGTWDVSLMKTKHLYFTATTNNLLVQILASVDGGTTYPITAVSEFAVNTGSPVSQTVTTYYTHLKVQVKPAVADTHGTLSTDYAGANF